MQKDLSNHSIDDPTLLKRKENANDCTTSTWQGLNKTAEPSLAVNKYDKEKNNSSKELKNSTTRLTLKQAGCSTKSRSGTRAVGILSILQGLTICEFFSELGPVSVAWRKTSSQPTGVWNSTPTNTARAELHSMITFHHANTRSSRAGRLRIAQLVSWSNCHPRVMSHSLPHLTRSTSTSSLSPTSLIFPTISPTRTRLLAHDEYLPCDVPRQVLLPRSLFLGRWCCFTLLFL